MERYHALYEIASSIQELEPWDYLLDVDKIILSVDDRLVLFSVLGSGRYFFGIVIYEGLENIYEFQKFSEAKVGFDLEHHYIVKQSYTLCRFVKPQDLNLLDIKYYNEKMVDLHNDLLYPSFVTQKKGYLPREISLEETTKITNYLYHFKSILMDIITHKLLVSFDNNDFIMRKYCHSKNQWINEVGNNFRVLSPRYNPASLNKESLNKFLARPRIKNPIIIDYRYLNYPVVSDEITDAYFPLLVVGIDKVYDQVILTKLCTPLHNVLSCSFELIQEIFTSLGVPNEIIVLHDDLFHYLVDICHLLDIKLTLTVESSEASNFFDQFKEFSSTKSSDKFNNNQYM